MLSINRIAAAVAATGLLFCAPLVVATPPDQFGVPGCNDEVLALTVFQGDLIAGGRFTLAGSTHASRIARWVGSGWLPLGAGLEGVQVYNDNQGNSLEIEPHVCALAVYDGKLVAGGSFTTAGGSPAVSVAAWDGAAWHPLGEGIYQPVTLYGGGGAFYYFPPQVFSLAVYGDFLAVGGLFTSAGSIQAMYCAVWDGNQWWPLGDGMSGGRPPRVLSLAVDGNNLYAGGTYQWAERLDAMNIAKWDGLKWGGLGLGIGPFLPTTAVRSMSTFGSDLIVGGNFESADGVPVRNIAAWNGAGWSSLGDGIPNGVHALAVYGGELFAGAFRWTGSAWTNALQTDGPVRALTVYRDLLVAGGEFHQIGGRAAYNIGSWPDDITALFLSSFTAERRDRAGRLAWEILDPDGPVAFHVWRQDADGPRLRVSDLPVIGRDRFEFLDEGAPAGEADYWLRVLQDGTEGAWFGPAHLDRWVPRQLELAQNRPNPFNPKTLFTFTLPRAGRARLAVLDARGRHLVTLVDADLPGGEHEARWDGTGPDGKPAASGVYLARLETASGTRTRKVTLAR